MKGLLALAIGIVVGYQGVKPLTHLVYLLIIAGLITWHLALHA